MKIKEYITHATIEDLKKTGTIETLNLATFITGTSTWYKIIHSLVNLKIHVTLVLSHRWKVLFFPKYNFDSLLFNLKIGKFE